MRCESRGISKRCTLKGEFWHKSRDVPRKLFSFWNLFRIGKVDRREIPGHGLSQPGVASSSGLLLWDTSVFVPELALRSVVFCKAISGCAERCGKGGAKTLEGEFFSEAEPSARASRQHFFGRLSWAHPARCCARTAIRVATEWLAILESAR